MPIQNNVQRFNDLRERYPVFVYESYHYEVSDDGDFIVSFSFFVNEEIRYNPQIRIKYHPLFADFYASGNMDKLKNFVFAIGMIELLSYWKASCCPVIEVRVGNLGKDAASFWKKLYFNGLGEFFYTNSIHVSMDEIVEIVPHCFSDNKKPFFGLKNETIVPIGGGKDSVVTLEELRAVQSLIDRKSVV